MRASKVSRGYPASREHTAELDGASSEWHEESTSYKQVGGYNAMSVDVEEYFHVSAFEDRIERIDWDSLPSRVERSTDRIFELFDSANVKATFFTLGWIAERFPNLIKRITSEGHEIASHGFAHARVWSQGIREFSEDVSRTKKLLEDITGERVLGYRAPSFSINKDSLWAHDVLHEAGYEYSSSIYPFRHLHYGIPSAPRKPFRLQKEGLLEIPLTTARIFGRNLPAAGGGYFRLLPYSYSRWAIRRANRQDDCPAAFYFHPWEIDPGQPRIEGISAATKFRHYVNLERVEERLERVLADFRWARMDEVFLRTTIST